MGKALDLPIDALVPHARPMLLLDSMLEADETHNRCTVTIGPDTMFLEEGGVPAYVGIEYMAQAVAAHGGYLAHLAGEPVRIGFLLGTPRFVTHCEAFPLGSVLEIEAHLEWGDDELLRFGCRIRDMDTGRLLQEAGLNVFQPRDLDTYLQANRGG